MEFLGMMRLGSGRIAETADPPQGSNAFDGNRIQFPNVHSQKESELVFNILKKQVAAFPVSD